MSLTSHSKNVFEATIEDGKISGKRHGRVAMASPQAAAYFDKLKSELKLAKIEGYEIRAEENTRDAIVKAKIRVSFNGKEYAQKVQLSRSGAYKAETPKEPIDVGKDPETKKFCLHIAEEARRVTGQATWDYTKDGNPIPHEDIVLRQVREVLKNDVRDTNMRLVQEMRDLLEQDDVKREALIAFEDVMRDRVHNALEEFEKLPPETMHKFLDEMYCKKIHDA